MKLERPKVVQAALELLNEVGLDGVTTRRLAAKLGVQSPALYWHFDNKHALLNAMAEAMLAGADLHGAMQPGVLWKDWLAENARRFRLALLSYRDGARVHAGSRPEAASLVDLESQVKALVEAGFSLGDAARAGIVIGRFVVGWVLEEQADAEPGRDATTPTGAFATAVADYPALAGALSSIRDDSPDDGFEFGLQLLLDGLATRCQP
jgi:TetR/AcrR family tetracycline transcriptional repressor